MFSFRVVQDTPLPYDRSRDYPKGDQSPDYNDDEEILSASPSRDRDLGQVYPAGCRRRVDRTMHTIRIVEQAAQSSRIPNDDGVGLLHCVHDSPT